MTFFVLLRKLCFHSIMNYILLDMGASSWLTWMEISEYLKSHILFTVGTVTSCNCLFFPSDIFLFPAKKEPVACFVELPSLLASLLQFLHSKFRLSKGTVTMLLLTCLKSSWSSPGCIKSKLGTAYKACLGPRICSCFWPLSTGLHTHTHTHHVYPHSHLFC